MKDCCIQGPQFWASSSELFENWALWATRENEFIGTEILLGKRLRQHGLESNKFRGERGSDDGVFLKMRSSEYTKNGESHKQNRANGRVGQVRCMNLSIQLEVKS